MKIWIHSPLENGYEAPSTEHVTTDIARLDLMRGDTTSLSWVHQLPETFILRTRPQPISLKNTSARVSLSSFPKAQLLYDEDTLHSHFPHTLKACQTREIQLVYDNSNALPFLSFSPGDVVYTKPFASYHSVLIQDTLSPKTRRLYGYGGFYTEGLPLDQCQQVFFEVCEGYDKVEINLSLSQDWLSRGLSLPPSGDVAGQRVVTEASVTKEQALSLGAALAGGYCTLWVNTETYHSTQATRPHGHPHFIDITFVRNTHSQSGLPR